LGLAAATGDPVTKSVESHQMYVDGKLGVVLLEGGGKA
jgi:hypothetical protein